MAELQLSNVVTVSVSQTPTGVSNYNTSNVALFTDETPSPAFSDGYKIYKEPTEVATDFGSSSTTYAMALALFSQQPNILLNGGYLVVIPFEVSETLDAAITRTVDLVQYFGIMSTQIETEADMLAAAAVVAALTSKMAFFVQTDSATIDPGGSLDLLRSGGFTQSRGLYYGGTTDEALGFMASYVGRALSVVFSGSLTTSTMHLKQLTSVDPDSSMTQTLLTKAQTAGVDVYVSLQGYAAVFCSGENSFFDDVYNIQWIAGAMQVAGFNYLAAASTKIPQTEQGMDGLKGAYRAICEQAVSNGFCAPGTWNSPTTFGNQDDFYNNVSQFGYYIYSTPIAQQSQADRADRKAPLVQIAIKEAGAIHSSSVVVLVNP